MIAPPPPAGPDVAVIGGGAVGLATALALLRAGLRAVAVTGGPPPPDDGRTAALLAPSLAFLDGLGVGADLRAAGEPLRAMRIVDATGHWPAAPTTTFEARESGLDAFGLNVPNRAILDALRAALAREGAARGLDALRDERAGEVRPGPRGADLDLDGGASLAARVVVAADGARSPLRAGAGIGARRRAHDQSALTFRAACGRPHGGTSTEFHGPAGPFTLVPLPGDRVSAVLVERPAEAARLLALDDDALSREATARSGGLLGPLRVEGPRGLAPLATVLADRLTAPRFALAGEAAHALPPIGAQGLNLGLRDAAALAAILGAARRAGEDLGGAAVLARYARARRADVALTALAVDALNGSLLSSSPLVAAARAGGLAALSLAGPLRRAVMRAGMGGVVGRP